MIKQSGALAGAFLLCLLVSSQAEAQQVKVTSVTKDDVRLHGDIEIVVDGLEILLKDNPEGKKPPLLPYLCFLPPSSACYAMKGSTLRYISKDTATLKFTFDRKASDVGSRYAWNHILGGIGPFKRMYIASLGAEDTGPIASDQSVTFEVYPSPWSQIAIVVLVLLVIGFLVLVFKTDILKDPKKGNERTYSLGRFQMAFWFLIILGSFTYIWMVTGDLAMPETSLILMGISGATALGAIMVKPNPKKTAGRDKPPLVSFFLELLGNDEDPITLHRFQMFAWTMILGIIFVAGVFKDLAQPVLDSSLLTLMGISSGVYVGFKVPEK